MRERTLWLSSFGLGAATALLFDPVSGRRRRHRVKDAATHVARRSKKSASAVARDLRNRAHGIITAARHRFAREQPDDVVLEARVHSALGRIVSHPRFITVRVEGGCVVLDGPIASNQEKRIVAAVRAIKGVKHVETRFDRHIQPAHEAASESALPGEQRRPPQPDVLQRHWAPATRVIVGASGAALVGTGITRRDRAGIGLAAAGAALVARAATNTPIRDAIVRMKANRRAIP